MLNVFHFLATPFAEISNRRTIGHNRVAVGENFGTATQGSSFLATLGFEPESLWDSDTMPMEPFPKNEMCAGALTTQMSE